MMTYRQIFDLKFKKKIPTLKLEESFPEERKKIRRIALMELPLKTLKRLVRSEKELEELLFLKQSLFNKVGNHS